MYLIETIVLSIIAAFPNYSISEDVDEVGEFKTAGGAIRRSANSRYPYGTTITVEVWGTRPSYLTQGTKLV
jgi:hypothetical protein